MFAAKTVMLFGGIWLLLAFIILPGHASAGNVTLRSIDTFPLLDNPIPVQQAYLTWLPGKKKSGCRQLSIIYPHTMHRQGRFLLLWERSMRQRHLYP